MYRISRLHLHKLSLEVSSTFTENYDTLLQLRFLTEPGGLKYFGCMHSFHAYLKTLLETIGLFQEYFL